MVPKEGLCGGERLAHVYHILPHNPGIETLTPQGRGKLTNQTMPLGVHLMGFATVRLESSMQARIWTRKVSREGKVLRVSRVRYLLTRARLRAFFRKAGVLRRVINHHAMCGIVQEGCTACHRTQYTVLALLAASVSCSMPSRSAIHRTSASKRCVST